MTENQHMQIALKAAPDAIMRAWTDSLSAWFAEHADVSIPDKRYDFWGRYTIGNPDREAGRHPLLGYEAAKCLSFGWKHEGADVEIEISVQPRGDEQLVVLQYPGDQDFWFLSLENLRRHLDGKAPIYCDYNRSMKGDIHNSVEIDAPADKVFEALINPAQLERWIASKASVDPTVGGDYKIGWDFAGSLKILEIVPNESLKLDWTEGDRKNILHWTLAESGGKTRLTLVHSGFAPDEDSGLTSGWSNYMSWIKSIAEYGDDWQPALPRITPEMASFYPASIADHQSELV